MPETDRDVPEAQEAGDQDAGPTTSAEQLEQEPERDQAEGDDDAAA